MTRHEALTRAAGLIRLHMATPDAEVLATVDALAAEYADTLGKTLDALQDAQPHYGWARHGHSMLVARGAMALQLTVVLNSGGEMTAWRGFRSGEGRRFTHPSMAPGAVAELVSRR